VEHLKLTITLLHGKHGPHAWEQSGKPEPPVGYSSIPTSSFPSSCICIYIYITHPIII
jgi:hypothetical protein